MSNMEMQIHRVTLNEKQLRGYFCYNRATYSLRNYQVFVVVIALCN